MKPIPVFTGISSKRIEPAPFSTTAQDAGLWTRDETAHFLRMSPRLLFAETKLNRIRHIRFGRLVRYDPVDVRAYLEGRKRGGLIPIREDQG